MLLMNLRTIVLIITPTIALIEDHEKELKQKNISGLALTAATIKVNPNI